MEDSDWLGNILVRHGTITSEQLDLARDYSARIGQRLAWTLVLLHMVPEWEMVKIEARQYDLEAVDLAGFQPNLKLVRLFPGYLGRQHLVFPVRKDAGTLVVAQGDPAATAVMAQLGEITGRPIRPVLAAQSAITTLVSRYFCTPDDPLSAGALVRTGNDPLPSRVIVTDLSSGREVTRPALSEHRCPRCGTPTLGGERLCPGCGTGGSA